MNRYRVNFLLGEVPKHRIYEAPNGVNALNKFHDEYRFCDTFTINIEPLGEFFYGVYNLIRRRWEFNIKADTVGQAFVKLYCLIGDNAYKWRYDIRRMPMGGKKINENNS